MVYSTDPHEGFINEYGIEKVRSAIAQDIFAQDLQSAYEDQTKIRQRLKEAADKLIREILSLCAEKPYENAAIEQKLIQSDQSQIETFFQMGDPIRKGTVCRAASGQPKCLLCGQGHVDASHIREICRKEKERRGRNPAVQYFG